METHTPPPSSLLLQPQWQHTAFSTSLPTAKLCPGAGAGGEERVGSGATAHG